MEVLRDGSFTFNISPETISRGLRPHMEIERDKKYLVECIGAIGYDKVLQVIDNIQNNRIDTSVITDPFPYPQIFICREVIIVCGKTSIYEYHSLTPKLTNIPEGLTWTCIDYGKFIYLSNCTVAIVRNTLSGEYDYADYESCRAGDDLFGQAVINPCE